MLNCFEIYIGKNRGTEASPVYEDPDSFLPQPSTAKFGSSDNNIELTECPAYENPKRSRERDIELQDCQAYGAHTIIL